MKLSDNAEAWLYSFLIAACLLSLPFLWLYAMEGPL
jgi:hypothetical protein